MKSNSIIEQQQWLTSTFKNGLRFLRVDERSSDYYIGRDDGSLRQEIALVVCSFAVWLLIYFQIQYIALKRK